MTTQNPIEVGTTQQPFAAEKKTKVFVPEKADEILISGMRTRKLKTSNGHNSLENWDDFISEFSSSCPKAEQELARNLLEQNKMDIFRLKELLDFQKEAWLKGKIFSLEEIILAKGLLDPQDISFLKDQAETKKIPALLPVYENKEVVDEKYIILEKIGTGDTGTVYKVEYLMQCTQTFSLKIMHPFFSCHKENINYFLHDMRLASKLKYPSILSIFEFGVLPNHAPYILADYSPGKSLKILLSDRGKWDILRSVRIVQQILSALAYSHSFRVYHSHIKPANIIIENGIYNPERVKIADFGLSRLFSQGEDMVSITHGSLESMLYMSPEQAWKGKVDHRSDLYSTAILLYEMITGQPIFQADTLSDMLFKQVFTKPVPPMKINPLIPRELNRIIMKALEKEPEERFQKADEFLAALQNFRRPAVF